MSELGKPANLDIHLTKKTRNRINRIGVELEGGWLKLPSGSRIIGDGSVKGPGLRNEDGDHLIKHVGELPSPPLSLSSKDNNFWESWMVKHYPKVVNHTCGMHVHMSFDRVATYSRLMTATYPATLVKYVISWAKDLKIPADHPIWPRLLNQNEYCQHVFHAEEQVRTADKDYDHHRVGHRYTVVHYPWTRHSTVECRLLPMMETAEKSIELIKYLMKVTNAFLLTTAKREEKVLMKFSNRDDVGREVRRVVV